MTQETSEDLLKGALERIKQLEAQVHVQKVAPQPSAGEEDAIDLDAETGHGDDDQIITPDGVPVT